MAAPLIAAGIAISKPIIKKYGRRLIKKAKPLIEKGLEALRNMFCSAYLGKQTYTIIRVV